METVPFTESLLETHCIVDVRSPSEFAEDHLPGAISVPLLDDAERAEVGTLYKQQGPLCARRRGLELTAARFPLMVESITREADGRPILVYCWRGGLRSKTVATILDLAGFSAFQLQGGYKAFRAVVTSYFDPFIPKGPLVVLHGMTGTGKTVLLHRLRERGVATVDLEGLSCHRGSAFGELGLVQDLSQKRFETLLWQAFHRIPAGTPIVVEGESRRIGRIFLPGDLYDKMREGILVWCEASMDTRVSRLIEDYARTDYAEGLASALDRIRKKLGEQKHAELKALLAGWNMDQFMRELMTHYYDRLYYKYKEWTEDLVISLEDYSQAAEDLARYVEERLGATSLPSRRVS